MSQEKKYVRGNAKEISFDNGGDILNLSFNIYDFLSGVDNKGHKISEFADENGWVKITAGRKREVDQYGNTHSLSLNEWKPDEDWKSKAGNPPAAAPVEDEEPPF